MFRNLMRTPGERIFFKDMDSRFQLVSSEFLADQAHGASLDQVVGKSDFDFFTNDHACAAFEDEQRVIRTGEPVVGKIERETFSDRPDAWVSTTKTPLRDDEGKVIGTMGISRDVTAQVLAELALAHQALHDPVTGLANRLALMDRLSQALLALGRAPGRLAVLFIDLDNFKEINDSFGHETGDRVLVEVGRRLSSISRRGDTVARFGGDEFVLLCSVLHDDDDVRLIASRALREIGAELADEGNDVTCRASIGVVVTSNPQADPSELLQQADIALYDAKAAGRACFRLFDAVLSAKTLANHELDAALRRAIESKQFFLVYQPLFSLEDQTIRGAEALCRWSHPTRGVIAPAEFIPFAEERGLIGPIDTFVLEEACRQLAQWKASGVCTSEFTMAVNLSAKQLADPTLVDRVRLTLRHHGLLPRQLCLEVTETTLVSELGTAASTLSHLGELGVKLALDDFGTGYSTLSHLQHLNVDILKIDRSFVEQVGGSDRDRRIVGAITAMGHALGMSVIGEGIETKRQLGELARLGCDEGQGFLLARPLAPDQVAELVTRRSPTS
jgi:diguanylate cyclase (GGDEF)-like protein/PAS domain S-box-containing protein